MSQNHLRKSVDTLNSLDRQLAYKTYTCLLTLQFGRENLKGFYEMYPNMQL